MCAKSFQSCLTLCDLMDCSPPGSFVHGILQARILEWVAMASPPPGDLRDPGIEPTSPCLLYWQVGSLPLMPPGKPAVPLTGPNFIDFYDHFPLILLYIILSHIWRERKDIKKMSEKLFQSSVAKICFSFFLINSWWSVQVFCCFMTHP